MKKHTKDSKVAIVVVTFNRKDFVLKNISYINQLHFKNFDIIVFDNGSNDGTREAIKEKHPSVQYYYSKENLGGAGGFKEGMKTAFNLNYEYVWCLDDDGAPHPKSLQILIDEAQKDPNSIYGARIIPIGQPKDSSFWEIKGPYNYKEKKYIPFSEEEQKEIKSELATHETATVALLGMFIPRGVIEKIGYPNDKLFLANDDVEYCLRAWSKGVKIKLVMKSTVEHPAMETIQTSIFGKEISVISMQPWKLYYYIRNIIAVNRKYFSLKTFIKMALATLITAFVNIKNNKKDTKSYIQKSLLAYKDGFFKKLL